MWSHFFVLTFCLLTIHFESNFNKRKENNILSRPIACNNPTMLSSDGFTVFDLTFKYLIDLCFHNKTKSNSIILHVDTDNVLKKLLFCYILLATLPKLHWLLMYTFSALFLHFPVFHLSVCLFYQYSDVLITIITI